MLDSKSDTEKLYKIIMKTTTYKYVLDLKMTSLEN